MTALRLAIVLLALAVPAQAAVDHAVLLYSIAQVETGGRARRGRAGETGEHQLTPAVRRQSGTAANHLRWLERHLPNPTPYRLALAWNAGLQRTIDNRTLPRHRDYAERVQNIYDAHRK